MIGKNTDFSFTFLFNFAHPNFITMKHITLTLISVLLFVGLMPSLHAQTATTPSGPVVMNFSKEHYDQTVLSNDDQQLVAYCTPIWQKLKKCYHSIVTYNKSQNTVSSCVLDLSADYKRMVAFDAGDSYFVGYSNYPKATKFEYATASIPKDCGANYAVNPRTVLSIDIDFNGYVLTYAAESADHSKHAIVFVNINKKQIAEEFYFYVYDEAGRELLYKVLSPEIYGDRFSVEDLAVTNEGEALLLMRTGTKNKNSSSAVHILRCTQQGGKSFVKPLTFGNIHSMRLLVLKNGNYFVGGYCAPTADEPTSEYFTCIFNNKIEDFEDVRHGALTENQKPKHEFMLLYFIRFYTQCTALHELEDGEVMMLGEHRAMAVETGQGTTYYHYARDIVYQHFDANGEMLHNRRMPKWQSFQFEKQAIPLAPDWFTYDKLGISFSSFVDNGKVYVLYQDTQENFNQKDGKSSYTNLTHGKSCTVLARMDDDGPEQKILMMPGKSKKVLHYLWLFDGKELYYGMCNMKEYSLEHSTLESVFAE